MVFLAVVLFVFLLWNKRELVGFFLFFLWLGLSWTVVGFFGCVCIYFIDEGVRVVRLVYGIEMRCGV